MPQTGWFKQQISHILEAEMKVQDQDVCRVGFSQTLSPWLEDAAFSLCPPMAFSLYANVPSVSSSS